MEMKWEAKEKLFPCARKDQWKGNCLYVCYLESFALLARVRLFYIFRLYFFASCLLLWGFVFLSCLREEQVNLIRNVI